MSGTTEGLRRKIAGAGDLEAVVRSMKALAASNIGQYEEAARSLKDYWRTVQLGLAACLPQIGSAPFAVANSSLLGSITGAIVFGSDQGLVGQFNEVLAEFALQTLKKLPVKTTRIWAVGERMQELVANTALIRTDVFSVPTSVNAIATLVGRILVEIQAAQEQDDVAQVYVFHNQLKSGVLYEPLGNRLLPLDCLWQRKLAALPWPTNKLPEVIEGAAPALLSFVREYLFVSIFQACTESLTSENASRLAGMQRAEKNIASVLEDLNRAFHRIRQESIDEELFDIISGYEALSDAASDATTPEK